MVRSTVANCSKQATTRARIRMARERKDFVVGVQIVVQTRRSAFRCRTVALRDWGLCQATVESLPDDRSTLRHVLAGIGLGFPAKSVQERANRDCTSPVTEAC